MRFSKQSSSIFRMPRVMKKIFWLLFVLTWFSGSCTSFSAQSDIKSRLELLKSQKDEILTKFIAEVQGCVKRRDTNHAAFRGCIDWHSAVHGTWALVKFTRISGDKRFVPLIEKTLSKENIDSESRFLAQDPNFEMP